MRQRAIRVASYAGAFAVTLGIVYVATRTSGQAATPVNHQAANASAQVSKSVALSASDARRIGVTYATASLGPLVKEVRIVGQVAFDETSVHTISPKIDGWVERLIVNA